MTYMCDKCSNEYATYYVRCRAEGCNGQLRITQEIDNGESKRKK